MGGDGFLLTSGTSPAANCHKATGESARGDESLDGPLSSAQIPIPRSFKWEHGQIHRRRGNGEN